MMFHHLPLITRREARGLVLLLLLLGRGDQRGDNRGGGREGRGEGRHRGPLLLLLLLPGGAVIPPSATLLLEGRLALAQARPKLLETRALPGRRGEGEGVHLQLYVRRGGGVAAAAAGVCIIRVEVRVCI
jgi:hypothetical protein